MRNFRRGGLQRLNSFNDSLIFPNKRLNFGCSIVGSPDFLTEFGDPWEALTCERPIVENYDTSP